MITLEATSRVGCLVAFSMVGGAIIGIAAAATIIPIDAFFFGSVFGSIIGAILAPAIAFCLFRKPLAPATLIVLAPALTVAIAAGLTTGSPLLTLASVPVFGAMAGFCYLFLPDTQEWTREIPGCPHCGYDTTGLTQCPECGAAVEWPTGITTP